MLQFHEWLFGPEKITGLSRNGPHCNVNVYVLTYVHALSVFVEVMGAVVSVLFIWVLTGVLIYLAIQRIINKQYEINALVMLLTAAAGLIINVM